MGTRASPPFREVEPRFRVGEAHFSSVLDHFCVGGVHFRVGLDHFSFAEVLFRVRPGHGGKQGDDMCLAGCERAVREGRLSVAESQALKRFYESELNGYAYLEP